MYLAMRISGYSVDDILSQFSRDRISNDQLAMDFAEKHFDKCLSRFEMNDESGQKCERICHEYS